MPQARNRPIVKRFRRPHPVCRVLGQGVLGVVLAVASATAAPNPARTPHANLADTPPARPATLDLPAWLDYKVRAHVPALPLEARLFYRRGLMLAASGGRADALRDVRGAAELDPGFVAPHLTMASWFLLSDPSQALLQYAAVVSTLRENAALQLAVAGNALVLGLTALFLALLAAGMMVVAVRQRELRHPWREWFARHVGPGSATAWSWALLLLPFAAGFGLAVPTALFLGLLWPVLKGRERTLLVTLVALLLAAPTAGRWIDRIGAPLREDGPPVWGALVDPDAAWDPARAAQRVAQAAAHPDDGFAQFAGGWSARRAGDPAAAERCFRRALQQWPDDPRVLVNLANALSDEHRDVEAEALYRRALDRDPGSAAAWYDLAQLATRHFDYQTASEALTRATALDFERVRSAQGQTAPDGSPQLIDPWLAPRTVWRAVLTTPAAGGAPAWPDRWRTCRECAGRGVGILAAVLAAIAITFGTWAHRRMPLRGCSNCGTVVCRRCAQRRRETALCPRCAAVEAQAETRDFGRTLLLRHRSRARRVSRIVRTSLATLVPGYGLIAFQRVGRPVVLLALATLLAGHALGLSAPFAFEPRLGVPGDDVPVALVVAAWAALYLVSVGSYLARAARADAEEAAAIAPQRTRATQATRRIDRRAA